MIDRETLIQVITAAQDSEVSLLMRHIKRHEDVDAGNLLRWLVEEHERKQKMILCDSASWHLGKAES